MACLKVQLAYQIPSEQRLGAFNESRAVCGWTPSFPSRTLRVQPVIDSSYIGAVIYGLNECVVVRVKHRQMDKQMCVSVQPSHAGGRWSRFGYVRRGTGGSGLTDDLRALSLEALTSLLPAD